jgi:hypothetical protein
MAELGSKRVKAKLPRLLMLAGLKIAHTLPR